MSEESPRNPRFHPWDCLFIFGLLAVALGVGLSGIAHHGYIGQDFDGIQGHNYLIRSYPEGYSYRLTNPPGLYLLGNFIFRHVSGVYYLEILAGFFLVINLAAVWLLFGLIWKMIYSWQLRYAAAAFITFVPFRTVHAIVIASDAFTLPFFSLVAVFTLRLFDSPRRHFEWLGLSLSLSAGLFFKYTFVGLLPAVAVLLAVALFRWVEKGARFRWAAIAALALSFPSSIFLVEMHQKSGEVDSAITSSGWLAKGQPSVMRWQDIFTLQRSDLEVFSAPQYFRDQVYDFRKYSYMALVHLSAFTDLLNFFQNPPEKISPSWHQRVHDGFLRERTPQSDRLQKWSVAWSAPCSVLAILGTLYCVGMSIPSLAAEKYGFLNSTTVVVTLLALGFYSPIFLSLHRIGDPYGAGFWLPRLVLPALLVFFVLGFALVDVLVRVFLKNRERTTVSAVCLAHTLIACALFVSFLS